MDMDFAVPPAVMIKLRNHDTLNIIIIPQGMIPYIGVDFKASPAIGTDVYNYINTNYNLITTIIMLSVTVRTWRTLYPSQNVSESDGGPRIARS